MMKLRDWTDAAMSQSMPRITGNYQKLGNDGRWIHFLESEPDHALPEVVMQRNPLWPSLEFSTIDTDSDTGQFSPLTRYRDFHLTKELANPNCFQRLRD